MKIEVTGRISKLPQAVYERKVLLPQFSFELENYLVNYIRIEKVLLKQYYEQGFINKEETENILAAIQAVKSENLKKSSTENLTDIALTLERQIEENMTLSVPNWHLDRSRNDFQACSQLMYAREQYINIIDKIQELFKLVINLVEKNSSIILPGYTHYQAAQIISVGFYLTSISHHLLETQRKMLHCLESLNQSCPLGGGALAGQEISWDVEQTANDLGFNCFIGHAMVSVSSRNWILEIGDSIVFFTNNLSRILTDFMNWGSSEYQYINLPDDLTGISSSMPQKRNFPILERIRGKTSHVISYYNDFLLGQRNTPFTNLVEVSKEASSNLYTMFNTTKDIIDLFSIIIENVQFDKEKIYEKCQKDYYGGFTLANQLTIQNKIPYRLSQVIVGKFITKSLQNKDTLNDLSLESLAKLCDEFGFSNSINQEQLVEIFDIDKLLTRKNSKGSTHPESVKEIIKNQWAVYNNYQDKFSQITNKIRTSSQSIDKWTPLKGIKL
ncbi:lyase family protein [Lysinibacillus sp. JNUCC 51]|uniref:lyase family protein n=1 Tax=Lysinibacillus sp. JNUCC-51 TaxID=2792479 RepID=UPI001934DA6F|nr:argininosuccinate lyase [Lysinibacillus sp. JNUCC-51]